MKEQIHTVPVNEAFDSGDECPFCYLERQVEEKAIRYTAGPGASYMEPEVRGATDSQGFCRQHFKKLYDYGNSLGNALMMQSYMIGMRKELDAQLDNVEPPKKGLFAKKQDSDMPILQWIRNKNSTCFLCSKINYNMNRYYATFFALVKEPEFRAKVESCKGFCMRHFTELLENAKEELPNAQREWFYPTVLGLMEDNLIRAKEDLAWFVGMFDYRQQGADWKNSRDAVMIRLPWASRTV